MTLWELVLVLIVAKPLLDDDVRIDFQIDLMVEIFF